ncbi:hypothetical protein P280DRAFT_467699, partial [Massarina eburnea CBS 473.64]
MDNSIQIRHSVRTTYGAACPQFPALDSPPMIPCHVASHVTIHVQVTCRSRASHAT